MNAYQIRRYIILPILALLAVFTLIYAYSHSRIEISVTGGDTSEYSYRVTNQSKHTKPTTINSNSKTLKRWVGKGNYEILVSQNGKSTFQLVQAKGLLSKKIIAVSLVSEKQRSFVGYNPKACAYYSDKLYSYNCGSSTATISLHVPATSTTPTHTSGLNPSTLEGMIEGIVKTKQGNIALIKQVDIESPALHILYLLDDNLSPVKSINAAQLDASKTYSLISYRDGFLAYNMDLNTAFYYDALENKPSTINLSRPSDSSLVRTYLGTSPDTIIIIYSSNQKSTVPDKKIKNIVSLTQAGSTKEYQVNGHRISSAILCGQSKLCVLSKDGLLVYSLNNNKASELSRVKGISAMWALGNTILLATDHEILGFNPENGSGYTEYNYDANHFCGLGGVDSDRYVLCFGQDSGSFELLIERGIDNKDNIDKKIYQLQKLSEASALSIYKSFIFISPNGGDPIYDKSLNSYVYDKTKINNSVQTINRQIDSLGIDRGLYTIFIK